MSLKVVNSGPGSKGVVIYFDLHGLHATIFVRFAKGTKTMMAEYWCDNPNDLEVIS